MDTGDRDPHGRFLAGVSGNPGGRPKGFAAAIRLATNDGLELIERVTKVLRDPSSSGALVIEASSWLSDRAFGKPKMTAEVLAGPPQRLDLSKLTNEQVQTLMALTKLATPEAEDEAADE